ncbi:unnamed protein product [Phytophthora fragariaefolia]|uniref:Unnamed protein product n=1 Tax=Phytophthora fragariaefolia TaxID=1490495 RepID=A0A9W6XMG7_9STRA|nr:unnamed protein product [Phytophthora fragariaefolia]
MYPAPLGDCSKQVTSSESATSCDAPPPLQSACTDHVEAERLGVRVGPDDVGEDAVGRDLLEAVEHAQLVQVVQRRTEPAVQAEQAVVHERAQRQEVEELHEGLVHARVAVVLLHALDLEAVDLRGLARLVVATQQRHALRVTGLEHAEQRHGLDAHGAAVHEVPEEDEARGRRLPRQLEELQQVVELPVDVAAHGHGRRHAHHVVVLHQEVLHALAQRQHRRRLQRLAALQPLQVPPVVRRHGSDAE